MIYDLWNYMSVFIFQMSMLGGLESPGINSLGGSKNELLVASAQGGVVPQVC